MFFIRTEEEHRKSFIRGKEFWAPSVFYVLLLDLSLCKRYVSRRKKSFASRATKNDDIRIFSVFRGGKRPEKQHKSYISLIVNIGFKEGLHSSRREREKKAGSFFSLEFLRTCIESSISEKKSSSRRQKSRKGNLCLKQKVVFERVPDSFLSHFGQERVIAPKSLPILYSRIAAEDIRRKYWSKTVCRSCTEKDFFGIRLFSYFRLVTLTVYIK